jgi:hypothetical protein
MSGAAQAQKAEVRPQEDSQPVLKGVVLEEGSLEPIQGVTVLIGKRGEESTRATTDLAGRFTFTQGSKVGLRIWVEPMEGWEPIQEETRVSLRAWKGPGVTILLRRERPGGIVSGRVLTAAGVPVEGAHVRVGQSIATTIGKGDSTNRHPGIDRYWVVAPGYKERKGEVEHESRFSNRQVIRLKPKGGEKDPR